MQLWVWVVCLDDESLLRDRFPEEGSLPVDLLASLNRKVCCVPPCVPI